MAKEYLFRGDVIEAKVHPLANRVTRVVCPEHPQVADGHWVKIHIRDGWGTAYIKDDRGKFSPTPVFLNFKYIEVWIEDEDGALNLDRAMRR